LELTDVFEASKKHSNAFVIGMNRFRKWVEENNEPPSRSTVQFLLPICLRTGKKSDVDIVMDYINRRGWNSDEVGLRNIFLVSMVKSGQYDKALKIYQAIEDSGEKLRLTGVFALLEAATNEGDFPTLLSLSRHLREKARGMVGYSSLHADVALSIEHVLLAIKDVEDAVAMEVTFQLLDTVRIIRRKLGEEMADVIREWVNRWGVVLL
jgi:pentatricopeptide repeat protein